MGGGLSWFPKTKSSVLANQPTVHSSAASRGGSVAVTAGLVMIGSIGFLANICISQENFIRVGCELFKVEQYI